MILGLSTPQLVGIICGAILLLALIVFLIIFLLKKNNTKSKIKVDDEFIDALIENYGGIANIKEVSVDNARLKVTVNDLDIVNLQPLKEASEAGVFVTGNTIKTLFKYDSNLIKNSISNKM